MGLLTYLVLVLLSTYLVYTSPVKKFCQYKDKTCPICRPGEYHNVCRCSPCPSGTYTSEINCEATCHRCYNDCRPDLHLEVVKNCTSTSDAQCKCEDGFHCVERDKSSGNCRYCQWSHDTSTADQSAISSTSGNVGGSKTDPTQTQLIAILCPLFIIGCIAFVFLFCVGCPGQESRFKQTVKKLCNLEKDNAHKPREKASEKQQSLPTATAHMGSVHVHNPGTVIFSLLSQFTGQIGPTKEDQINTKETHEDEMDCTVCQPTLSPSIPLSKEEHKGEADSIFFPSQEQGKDSRLSKEEEL